MSHRLLCVVVVIVAALTVASRGAEAQNLRVMPVPWVATDATVPHQAYNGHATTFKAIARGGNGTYQVEWDFQGDGTYDVNFTRTNRYDLSTTFTYPAQATTTTFQAKVRVTSNAQTVIGTYPVRVFADVPTDPNAATDRQLQVMRSVAVDDGLWYLHNQLTRSGNEEDTLTGAQAIASLANPADVNTTRNATTAGFLWSLSLNGHYAAFPTAYIGALPDPADNAARWANDPYAEDAMRVVNALLLQATIVTVDAASESNLTGFYPEVQQEPIYGTDDGVGLWIGYSPGDLNAVYSAGHAVSAFSVAHLGGFVAQVGDPNRILGRRFEHVLQQMVDGLVWAQNDIATAGIFGSWYYTPNANADDLSTSLWGMTGLWHADEFARDQGVIVPNIAKARLLQYIDANSNTCAAGVTGGSYTSISTLCDFTLSAGHVLALGWVGANQYDLADTRVAFPGYNSLSRGRLRSLYDTTLKFISNNFALTSAGQNSWNMGFVEAGNFGRVDGRGNHYGMLHWQDAARAVEPEVVEFGPGNNWARAFARYLINNQAANGSWNWAFTSTLNQNSDSTGGVPLRAVWAILVLSPDAIPPLAIGTSNLTTAPEGTAIAFNGAASDPGTGNPVYTWDFANGDTRPGQNVSYAFPDNGTFNVTLTSTSIGGSSVDTLPITITNVAPTAAVGVDVTVPEGSAQAFNVTFTDPGTGDTHTFAWTFGDTATAATQAASHAYADNGVFTVSATVTDDDGGAGTDALVATVTNVAPTITSTAPTTAVEGTGYSYTVAFTDPGTADTHTCTAPIAPAGATLTGCTLDWTPNFAQAIGAAAPVRLCVTDDDGGQTCQNYTIAVTFVDSDGDGLPDSWEISNFGDITSQDQFGDPDNDGMNNLQEFTNVTNPNVYDGPNTPTAAAPSCGGEIASLQTTLVANNAVDPQGAALTYDFQLYSDVGLTILVAEDDNVAQGSGATTSWAVPVNLLENTRYYWRVRAEDQFTYGPYSTPACDFFVNTVNEAPGVPRINTPSFGSQVNALRPDLTVDNASDPDEDVLTYTFEVYRDPALSNLVASQANVAAGATTTTWMVSLDLMEDHTYYWRVRATDPDGLSGDWSSTGQFFVTTMNAVPEPPALVSPQNGTTMANVRPELVILNADDSDLDPLVYDWELATDDTFTTIVDSGTDVPPQGAVNTAFALAADLTEDTTYCWRARSDDGQATSGYNTACFLVSETNGAPSVPTLNNPSATSTVTSVTPVYSWAPSTDPEDDPITYEVEVKDSTGAVVATVIGVSGTVTSMAGDLQNGATYTWHARAIDRAGAMSVYSADNTFTVDAPIDTPEIVVNGGCQTSGSGAGLGLVGLGLLGLLRRRRR